MPATTRRSGRTRKANTRYTNDGWSEETLQLLRGDSESPDPVPVTSEQESPDDDKEFGEQELQEASREADADGDDLSVASDSGKSSQVATPVEDEEEDGLSRAGDENDAGSRVGQAPPKLPAHPRSRGVGTVERGRSVKSGVWELTFGPDLVDLKPMLLAKEIWLYNTRDITLPSSKSLQEAILQRHTNATAQPDQYAGNQGLSTTSETQQKLVQISLQKMKDQRYLVDGHEHKLVLGPWSRQKMFDVPYMSSISLGQAWKVHEESDFSYHSGWLLNAGEKPQCMAWSRLQDEHQYLAVACRSTPFQRNAIPKVETHTSPAFSPSPPYPLSIQIWKVNMVREGGTRATIDSSIPPQLVQALGCRFGDIKQMAWVPRLATESSNQSSTDLGTLTILSTDGCIRLLNVPKQSSSSDVTYLEIEAPALQIHPPKDTIFTCFTFASSSDLILGTSLGHICAYNISQFEASVGQIEPFLDLPLHNTYLLSLATLDDEFSHFLVSLSATGAMQLTDLRSPFQDTLTLARARLPTRNLIANPHSRCFITTVDSSGNTEAKASAQTSLVAHNLRHFYSATVLSKFPEGCGTATALAGSPVHPCILMGNSGGTVWAQNIARRIFPTAKRNTKNDGGAWAQKVVEYEWIPRPSPPSREDVHELSATSYIADMEEPDLYNGPPVRLGTSRMHHGFKPETLDLSNLGSKKRKSAASGPDGESSVLVVFEEEQAVTAIEWNPNPAAAGWCGIGWGSGIVWITDLGHEAI